MRINETNSIYQSIDLFNWKHHENSVPLFPTKIDDSKGEPGLNWKWKAKMRREERRKVNETAIFNFCHTPMCRLVSGLVYFLSFPLSLSLEMLFYFFIFSNQIFCSRGRSDLPFWHHMCDIFIRIKVCMNSGTDVLKINPSF